MCWFPTTEAFHRKVITSEHVYNGDILPMDIGGLHGNENCHLLLSVVIFPVFQKQGISKKFLALLDDELRNIDTADIVSSVLTLSGKHFLNDLVLVAIKDMESSIKFMRLY